MFGVSKTTSSDGSGAVHRLTAVVFAAMALLAMTLAFGGTAQACPPGAKADSTRSLSQVIKKAAASKAGMVWAANHVAKIPSTVGACCGGSHAGGSGCQSACSSCAVAIAVAGSGVFSPIDAIVYR